MLSGTHAKYEERLSQKEQDTHKLSKADAWKQT